ncbi:MAG TPA: hypothetical protein VLD57_00800 [Blastocatellia bacterium]|nr:hypothetical protein [Blastocatellia bacterium]
MYQFLRAFLLTILLFAPATGAGTKLTTTWRDPQVATVNFSKIVVAFISKDADLRRRVEGGLARRIPRSVAASTLVPDEEIKDREAVKARLLSNGVDGAIVVRLVDMKRETVVSMGDSWVVGLPSYWDTWDTNWITINTATYAFEEKIVTADIILYSVDKAKPIWVGRMKATNPKNLRELLDDLVKAGAAELKKQKLI